MKTEDNESTPNQTKSRTRLNHPAY